MIPITKPFLGKEEAKAAQEAILSGWVTQGPKVKEFEDSFAKYVNSKHACAVSSCTTALHLSLLAVGVSPGDIVITVSHSFIATANSIRYCGAEPVFIDIDVDTYNISTSYLETCIKEDCELKDGHLYYKNVSKLISEESSLPKLIEEGLSSSKRIGRIAAILVVHQLGMPCDLINILSLAQKYKLPVVEDCACAVGSEITLDTGASWDKIGKPHGDIACFSFHPRKVLTTGDGGMITTNNTDFDNQIRLLRHHGMSVSDIDRHKSNKIIFEEYVTTAYNYRMTDIQAAIGIEQLKKLPDMISKRREIAKFYTYSLSDINWVKLPVERKFCKANWQSFPIRILNNSPRSRDDLIQYLLDNGISTRRGVMNSHQEKPYISKDFSLPNSELARDSVILLPIFQSIKKSELKKIVETLKNA